jgi:hypothetical protein
VPGAGLHAAVRRPERVVSVLSDDEMIELREVYLRVSASALAAYDALERSESSGAARALVDSHTAAVSALRKATRIVEVAADRARWSADAVTRRAIEANERKKGR